MRLPKPSSHRGACRRHLCLAAALLALGSSTCVAAASPRTTPAATIKALADRYVAAYFDAFPDEATISGATAVPHDRLPDLSPAARAAWQAREDAIWQALTALDATRLPAGSAEAVTYGFLKEWLRNSRGLRVCHVDQWNLSPTINGWPNVMAGLANAQPLGTAEKDAAALRRFSQLPRYIDQDIANLRDGLAHGYSAPKASVRARLKQIDGLLAAPIAESPFVAMAPADATELRARLEALDSGAIRPALVRYRDFLRGEYLGKARDAVGVSANPDGAACYRAAIRYHSTVDIAPEAVHRIGLEQMARIRGEMRVIAERSFGSSDVGAVLKRLKTERQYLFSSREEMLGVATAAAQRAQRALPRWFGILPRTAMKIEPAPAFSDEDAYYYSAAEDGSRPGIYYVNLNRAGSQPRAEMESTTFHEGYPGHHLQMTIALERTGLHPISRYFFVSGFAEGWGLYSEQLAGEMGLYTSDVYRMGQLGGAALRAARLVVDSGIHALGWSRRQAIDYLMANTVLSAESAAAKIDRYIAWPGQATAYMLGNLEILRLRGLAEARLGEAFDIRAFHDRVLEDGAVPLTMLRAKIERWLEQTENATPE